MDNPRLTNPKFELLVTSDINVSKDKKPMMISSSSKTGLTSIIAILITALFIIILTFLVLSSSSKVSAIDSKLTNLTLIYKANLNKANITNETYITQKKKNEVLSTTITQLNQALSSLQKENAMLIISENDWKRKANEYKQLTEQSEDSIKKDIEKLKTIYNRNQYYYTLKFETINGGNVQSIRDTVILTSQKEIDFIERITKGRIMSVCYSSKRDGLDGEVFMQKCQELAPTVVLLYIENGAKFGGYTTMTWQLHHVKDDPFAFLFNVNDEIVLKQSKTNWSVSSGTRGLPSFGYGDFKIFEDGTGRFSIPGTYGDGKDIEYNRLTQGVNYIYTYILEVFVLSPMVLS